MKDTLVSNKWNSLPEPLFISQILIMILLIFADPAHLALNIRIDLPNLQFIHEWYQKSHRVVYIWTMLLISWVQIGWYLWMLTPYTLVSTLPNPFPQRVLLTYWSRTFHISSFHTSLLLTMPRALHPQNSKSSAKREGSSTWQELHTIHQPTEQLSVYSSLSNKLYGNLHNFQRRPWWTFLHQYRHTPTDSRFSPSQLLNGRQIRS